MNNDVGTALYYSAAMLLLFVCVTYALGALV